jgi:hypothetical protein
MVGQTSLGVPSLALHLVSLIKLPVFVEVQVVRSPAAMQFTGPEVARIPRFLATQ